MHEVEPRHVRNVGPQRVIHGLRHFVPAHVRDFQVLTIFVKVLAEKAHLTGESADAINTAALFAALHQRLHAHADPEKRTVLTNFTHQGIEAQPTNLRHTVTDRADTGKHDAVSFTDDVGIAGNQHATGADVLQRLGHRVQIAHAIVDNGNGLHYSTPLVEGIWPAMRSSSSTAMRSARPNALKTVSIWW